jgi:hypothetical protein
MQNAKRNMLSLPKPLPVKVYRIKLILSKGGAFDLFSIILAINVSLLKERI